jgi:hypothetical protein
MPVFLTDVELRAMRRQHDNKPLRLLDVSRGAEILYTRLKPHESSRDGDSNHHVGVKGAWILYNGLPIAPENLRQISFVALGMFFAFVSDECRGGSRTAPTLVASRQMAICGRWQYSP